MIRIEIYDDEGESLLFCGDFAAVPRTGEVISKNTPPGFFQYYIVKSVWYREEDGCFQTCVAVKLDD